MNLNDAILQLPKVELHVHFEGSIQPASLLKIAKSNGVSLPATNEEELEKWFQFRNFEHFVEIYTAASASICTAADLEFLAEEFAKERVRQNIIYSEVHYTATSLRRSCKLSFEDQLNALHKGVAKVAGTKVNWIIDIVREYTEEEGIEIAEFCAQSKHLNVCAMGLSGIELKTPLTRHEKAFKIAHEAEVPISAHCGETQGPESIWETLEIAKPNRIGHGVRAVEDGKLVQKLRDDWIHVEVNPTSNVCLSVFPDLASHTLPRMLDEGLFLSINSDDPPMFSTTLTDEYLRCMETFELPLDIIYTLLTNATQAAFLPKEDKLDLRNKIAEGFNQLPKSLF